jgi:hypothetical protein
MKKFLIQFEEGPDTRWHTSDDQILHTLEVLSKVIARDATHGSVPNVSVLVEEKPLGMDAALN